MPSWKALFPPTSLSYSTLILCISYMPQLWDMARLDKTCGGLGGGEMVTGSNVEAPRHI